MPDTRDVFISYARPSEEEAHRIAELLRGEGKLKRRGDDMAVLKLQKWLQDWTQLSTDPLHYLVKADEWRANFGCSSDRPSRQ